MRKRTRLHQLVDALSEGEVTTAQRLLEALCVWDHADAVLRKLSMAPYDDEPETEDERTAVAEAYEDAASGRVRPWEEVRQELASGG